LKLAANSANGMGGLAFPDFRSPQEFHCFSIDKAA